MIHSLKKTLLVSFAAQALLSVSWCAASNPMVGSWGFFTPNQRAGWLGIEQDEKGLAAKLLWASGSVTPVESVKMEGDTLILEREMKTKLGSTRHKLVATQQGDDLVVRSSFTKEDGSPGETGEFIAHRQPPLPAKPDLSQVKFGSPVSLIAKEGMSGWQSSNGVEPKFWSVNEGVLSNRVVHEKGVRGANLRTAEVFEDFRLVTEVRTLPKSNSGIYLRGVYEIQIIDSHGKPLDSHNMGALYSRLTPAIDAEKAVGEWQTLEITLVDQHVTVVLNGQTLIDNEPALGCTGGALTWDVTKPGPIMLQGDHSDIDYRNMVLTPVLK
ncbi:DUF1080 domain-containing protein [Prosthecobacter sp.]|uniref:DUF1080 domain-containing protein n=1 Tax=Prosthecobacter sp. TaxID=1965333 RepID=UPI0037846D11